MEKIKCSYCENEAVTYQTLSFIQHQTVLNDYLCRECVTRQLGISKDNLEEFLKENE